jgi:hypothetical protein
VCYNFVATSDNEASIRRGIVAIQHPEDAVP